MKLDDFSQYLKQFGADLNTWPKALGLEARAAIKNQNEFAQLLQDETEFESLLKNRHLPEPSTNLEWRIIQAAQTITKDAKREIGPKSIWQNLFEIISPKPAIAFALIFIFGFGIGYFQDIKTEEELPASELASLLYNEEEPLWTSDSN